MREIKFRAWNTNTERLIEWDEILDEWKQLTWVFASDKMVLMQYTGLKDKNGKEIYEGDIVTGRNGTTKPMKVVWGHHAWGLSYRETSAPGFYDWNINEVEVIGNIYENSDLIQNV